MATLIELETARLRLRQWRTCGFIGFCLLMNSDVLIFNRLFRFIPGVRSMARLAGRIDAGCLSLPFLRRAGLQVIGAARKDSKMIPCIS